MTTMDVATPEDCELFVRTEQAQIIRSVVELLKDLVFEATFVFSPTGIKVSSMDSSKSSLVYLKLDAAAFEDFHVTREHQVGVSLQLLYKLVKIASSSDTIAFFVRKQSTHELGIHIENTETHNRTVFSLKMLDLNTANITLPPLEFDYMVQLNSATFQRLIRDMQNLAPFVTISTTGNGLVLSCSGDFAQQTTTIGAAEDITEGTPEATPELTPITEGAAKPPPFSSTYSLKYLSLFSKSSTLSSSLSMYLRRDHPLTLDFAAGSLGSIIFLLSPLDE